MSSGRVHQKATVILAGVSVAFCYHYDWTQWHSVGVLSGLVLTPDLDVDHGSISNHTVRSIPIIGSLSELI